MNSEHSRRNAPRAYAADILGRFRFIRSDMKDETVIVAKVRGFDFTFARIEVGHLPDRTHDAIDLARAIEIAIRKAAAYKPRKRRKGRGR